MSWLAEWYMALSYCSMFHRRNSCGHRNMHSVVTAHLLTKFLDPNGCHHLFHPYELERLIENWTILPLHCAATPKPLGGSIKTEGNFSQKPFVFAKHSFPSLGPHSLTRRVSANCAQLIQWTNFIVHQNLRRFFNYNNFVLFVFDKLNKVELFVYCLYLNFFKFDESSPIK